MTVFAPSNRGVTKPGWERVKADAEARAAADAAREVDPVERAIRTIRSRGRVIFRASVHGGPEDRWKHNGQLLDAEAVIALAENIQRLSGQIKPVPPASPIPASPQPIRQSTAERAAVISERLGFPSQSKALQPSTPPASATGNQEAPMPAINPNPVDQPAPHTGEDNYARERGTNAAAVRKELAELKNVLGLTNLAQRLGVGKSSIGNIVAGHAIVGPTILNALYGHSGHQLKPSLASLLAPPKPADEPVLEPELATVAEATTNAPDPNTGCPPHCCCCGPGETCCDCGDTIVAADIVAALQPEFEPGDADVGDHHGGPRVLPSPDRPADVVNTFLILDVAPDLAQLNVSDLLAGARRRRDQLQAELADIDAQIRAVIQLAGMAA